MSIDVGMAKVLVNHGTNIQIEKETKLIQQN